ncbi:2-hydroxycarboxylate transporter family protein [Mycoavidus sp. SF9855]|uniref:2-hydroxycarboxylate transporter family protein n=1 Tax=Mycoavidus sp. SF9855 TaxID=2968475 RepID=UPI00211B83CD|nr:2-hydroxycarboxylate transporter family protein [Mycoavidus sp. SF9855]UUM20811.1 2-hydroxycarboxylate transporter family protein [Mycoavidus sp. SF9855]
MDTSSAVSSVLVHKNWRYFLQGHKTDMFRILLGCLQWQKLMNLRIGIIPLPVYSVILVCLSVLLALGKVSGDISIMFALLTIFGFTFAELGARIPGLRQIGGPVIVTIFLPACLVHYKLLPNELVGSINGFWQSTKILYLFIACVIVGSILSMDRRTLVTGIVKIFIPIATGSVLATIAGTLTGLAFGLSAHHTFFYIIIPIMAGGIGEGAIPLTLGYADILNLPQNQLFAQIVPAIVLGNLMAIICASLLNQLGKSRPHYTGQGHLYAADEDASVKPSKAPTVMVEHIATAGMIAISFYILGILVHKLTGLPAPVGMLFLAVLAKLTYAISPKLEEGARTVYHFFSTAVTYPLLFAIGITTTSWSDLMAAFTLANVVTIAVTVFTLTMVGFFVGKWVGLYPIESAIINACHSGMGGIGDVAILTSASRLELMPFAQIATRLGGALTITGAIVLLGLTA